MVGSVDSVESAPLARAQAAVLAARLGQVLVKAQHSFRLALRSELLEHPPPARFRETGSESRIREHALDRPGKFGWGELRQEQSV